MEEVKDDVQAEEVEMTENQQTNEQENTTYTQSEVDRQISKAVESALSKRESKLQKELEERIEKERQDAAEYAKLTEKERAEADYQKRLEVLEAREKEINNRQLLGQIESDLKENELPTSLAETLLTIQDNEKIKSKIVDIKKEIDDAVNAKVKEALRQDTPSQSTNEKELDPFAAKLAKYK